MHQDYRLLTADQLEAVEKQCLRTVIQAVQEYSAEAKQLFDMTAADSETEVIVLAEDILQYALEVAECYPINKRYAGFIDYKRVRWLSTPWGLFPQVLLVDAKASTENNRTTLQQSPLPMDAEFVSIKRGQRVNVELKAVIQPHLSIPIPTGEPLLAVTTSVFVHFFYRRLHSEQPPYRDLRSMHILLLPHQSLKDRYNPNPETTFFGEGKHSPGRGEAQRIRVYFSRLRRMCPWRLQELEYLPGERFAAPVWRDVSNDDTETSQQFQFIGR